MRAALNEVDSDGNTLAHFATRAGRDAMIDWLGARGVPLGVRNNCGETPFMLAARKGKMRCAIAIAREAITCRRSMTLSQCDIDGISPEQVALDAGFDEMAAFCRELAVPGWRNNSNLVRRLQSAPRGTVVVKSNSKIVPLDGGDGGGGAPPELAQGTEVLGLTQKMGEVGV